MILAALACSGCMPDIGLGLSPAAPTAVVQAPQDEGTAAEKGRAQFAHANFGLAERYFREAVEREAGDVDSWIGLGASYDQLKRFDLADRAYENAIRIGGRLPGILNNQGYSYFLRGDHRRARALLKEALRGDPTSQAIQSNLSRLGAL